MIKISLFLDNLIFHYLFLSSQLYHMIDKVCELPLHVTRQLINLPYNYILLTLSLVEKFSLIIGLCHYFFQH